MSLKSNKQEDIMKKYNTRKPKNKIAKILELPQEVVTNEPKFTIVGFNEILIENYKAILEYEDFYIKINTHIGAININGFNLKLKEMTGDDIMVIGNIESIDFESITD
jgi:sporulation protein YqfC